MSKAQFGHLQFSRDPFSPLQKIILELVHNIIIRGQISLRLIF